MSEKKEAPKRVYKLVSKGVEGFRLVRAKTRNTAISHASKDQHSATIATQDEIIDAMQKGVKVEEVDADGEDQAEGGQPAK